jgi:DNA polymerase I-like protein with 3'-5' exonuclease and polymerase domains
VIWLNADQPDKPRKFLVTCPEELPPSAMAARLYLDFETRSGDRKRPADNPWAGDRISGAAVTWDDHPHAYYVPVRHNAPNDRWNLPVETFRAWLRDTVRTATWWGNHNVKFDAHFADADGATFTGEIADSLNMSKLVDSDRGYGRGGYGLDSLSSDWLGEMIDVHDQAVQAYLQSAGSKDYADVPADVMGSYACQDVLTNRGLFAHLHSERDACARQSPRFPLIWEVERKLTPVLWDMERRGLRVDPLELKKRQLVLYTELSILEEEIHKLTGYPAQPSKTADCYEILVNRFGLPVLSWTDEEYDSSGKVKKEARPSFDKDALKQYALHPDVVSDERRSQVVGLMQRYKKRHTMLTFFVEPFLRRQVDGRLHPVYNQLVRTGRMSAKAPNSQQQTPESKELILPDSDDDEFLSCDASQIEFRLIAHYSRDRSVLDAYERDPDTDFHRWVADMCGTGRDPAKTINFCMGYGGGKKKVLAQLASNMEVVASMAEKAEQLVQEGKISPLQKRYAFEALCGARAEDVYRTYHATLPGLKRVTNQAALTCKTTGYVFNEYGRIRRMPAKASWRAFNSMTQGLAMDIMKAGMVATAPRFCQYTRDLGIDLRINVHDEDAFHGRRETLSRPDVQATVVRTLERALVPLRVPMRFEAKLTRGRWRAEKTDRVAVDRSLGTLLPSNVEWYEHQCQVLARDSRAEPRVPVTP